MTDPLDQLRGALAASNAGLDDPALFTVLSVVEARDGCHVNFFGSPFEEAFEALCEALASPGVAARLASLTLRCPDEGANGTCNWDLSALADAPVTFPALRSLCVEQGAAARHNQIIVAASFEEEGVLGRLLSRAPLLGSLTSPTAPDAGFFERPPHPLRYLNIDAGYDHQSFVTNLASAACFPGLTAVEFGELDPAADDGGREQCTPLADYLRLVRSPAFAAVRCFTLRNPALGDDELGELRSLASPGLQLRVVRCSAQWVRQEPQRKR